MTASAIPQHIAIIPDGNRRWSRQRGLPTFFGHKKSVDNAEAICLRALQRGVKVLTMWGFSTKNWKRPKTEVSYLMKLFENMLVTKVDSLHRHNIRLKISGRVEEFTPHLRQAIERAVAKTKQNTLGILHICLNYGGRAEIVDAMKRIAAEHIAPGRISERTVASHLYTPGLPDVDLVIRTSGEYRLSGFLPWQAEDAEYLFLKKHWPSFTPDDIDAAIAEYQKRQRRFGV